MAKSLIWLMTVLSKMIIFHYPKSPGAVILWLIEEVREFKVKSDDIHECMDIVYCLVILDELKFYRIPPLDPPTMSRIIKAIDKVKALNSKEFEQLYLTWSWIQFRRLRKIRPLNFTLNKINNIILHESIS